MINIVTSFYISKLNTNMNNARNIELFTALKNNMDNIYVEKIHLFLDDIDALCKIESLSTHIAYNKINIIDDPIFDSINEVEESSQEKIDITSLDRENKLKLINDYLKKKSIKLDEANMLKIENIIDNPEISLRKYITISKLYQDISKISFIKKIDETSYAVILDDKVKKGKTSSFFK